MPAAAVESPGLIGGWRRWTRTRGCASTAAGRTRGPGRGSARWPASRPTGMRSASVRTARGTRGCAGAGGASCPATVSSAGVRSVARTCTGSGGGGKLGWAPSCRSPARAAGGASGRRHAGPGGSVQNAVPTRVGTGWRRRRRGPEPWAWSGCGCWGGRARGAACSSSRTTPGRSTARVSVGTVPAGGAAGTGASAPSRPGPAPGAVPPSCPPTGHSVIASGPVPRPTAGTVGRPGNPRFRGRQRPRAAR
jgi:hypothetical protein